MYLADLERNRLEAEHIGTPEQFLASLAMRMVIAPAQPGDMERAEELTVRTNQLNTTGYAYSYEQLDEFRRSPDHTLLIASLDDKYGSYGKIGLALVERTATVWTIKLLLMSCRVMSRGVGTVMLSYILKEAQAAGVRLLAEFVANNRNRMMYATYKFAGFKEVGKTEGAALLENDLGAIQPYPAYVQLQLGA
jgi:FkbH-like protein